MITHSLSQYRDAAPVKIKKEANVKRERVDEVTEVSGDDQVMVVRSGDQKRRRGFVHCQDRSEIAKPRFGSQR